VLALLHRGSTANRSILDSAPPATTAPAIPELPAVPTN
jgi:hypothetical protein